MMITRYAPGGAVAAANHLAAAVGTTVLARGGNAVDAAIAAGAVMAVTSPHMCGLGGDLFAMIARAGETPVALNASGRAGSGARADRLRAEGALEMPFQHDVRSITVPGCVDGWAALHERFGTLELAELLAPAQGFATDGFPVSPTLAQASLALDPHERKLAFGSPAPLVPGRRLVLPQIGDAVSAIAARGRAGFYEDAVGQELIAMGEGEFTEKDLRTPQADWVDPLSLRAFGHDLWAIPPNSQGYLVLASVWMAERIGLPDDPADERWAFLLVEAARHAAFDRSATLFEHADGAALVAAERLLPRVAAIGESASRGLADVYEPGDTTYICAVDRDRTGVSLIMSNAADFGSRLVLPRHGIFLHNRGMGFSLQPGHPAEYGPHRRPPHTLTPLLVTDPAGALNTVIGTMGADAQPQVLLQLLVRLLALHQDPGEAVAAPRWVLSRESANGFDTWNLDAPPLVRLEPGAPAAWSRGLRDRCYQVIKSPPGAQDFGHAQVIHITDDGMLAGAADPRAGDGAFSGC